MPKEKNNIRKLITKINQPGREFSNFFKQKIVIAINLLNNQNNELLEENAQLKELISVKAAKYERKKASLKNQKLLIKQLQDQIKNLERYKSDVEKPITFRNQNWSMPDSIIIQNFIPKINDFNEEFSSDFKKEIIDAFNLLKNQNSQLKKVIAAKDTIIEEKESELLSYVKLALSTKEDLAKVESELMAFKVAAIASKKDRFYFTLKKQNWSFPDTLIYYITKNPATSKGYQKMVQSCKHFFIKNPILIVPELDYYEDQKWSFKYLGECRSAEDPVYDLKKLSSKIWITESLSVVDFPPECGTPNEISSIIPNIYRCDGEYLRLYYQLLSFNEFLFISSKTTDIVFDNTILIKNEDGTVATLEKLVEALPKIKEFHYNYDPTSFTTKTLKNLFKIPHFSQIKECNFYDVPESFDIDTLHKYKEENKRLYVTVKFCKTLSEAFKTRVKAMRDLKKLSIYIP